LGRPFRKIDLLCHDLGEILDGAFWEMRQTLGKHAIDPLLAEAWRLSSSAETFLECLLALAKAKRSEKQAKIIREILHRREFPLPAS
jgi:hypothetical protein